MSTDALLARLARLDDTDRAWLLGELPPRMRTELLGLLSEDDEKPAAVPKTAPITGIESLEPEPLARLLENEPAWLVSAATRGADSRWRARLLAAMPSRRRHEVELADRTGAPLAAHAAQIFLDLCRARVGAPDAQEAAPPRSRFADLVDSLRSRFA
jgi:hypothetical protein